MFEGVDEKRCDGVTEQKMMEGCLRLILLSSVITLTTSGKYKIDQNDVKLYMFR